MTKWVIFVVVSLLAMLIAILYCALVAASDASGLEKESLRERRKKKSNMRGDM